MIGSVLTQDQAQKALQATSSAELTEVLNSHVNASDASSVVSVGRELLLSAVRSDDMDEAKAQAALEECAVCAPAMISAMRIHPDNGDVQRFAVLVLLCGLDSGLDSEHTVIQSRLAEAAAAGVQALSLCLTCVLSPMHDMPALMEISSNRAFERDLLKLLSVIYDMDEGVALIEAGVISPLVKALQFVDASKDTEMITDQYGEPKSAECECKGREVDLLQCLLRSQPSCREAVAKAGACDALIAAMKAHSTDHDLCAVSLIALNELVKEEACHDMIEVALNNPELQEAIKLGSMSPLEHMMKVVRDGLRANKEK